MSHPVYRSESHSGRQACCSRGKAVTAVARTGPATALCTGVARWLGTAPKASNSPKVSGDTAQSWAMSSRGAGGSGHGHHGNSLKSRTFCGRSLRGQKAARAGEEVGLTGEGPGFSQQNLRSGGVDTVQAETLNDPCCRHSRLPFCDP